jgi:carbonic anhydrase
MHAIDQDTQTKMTPAEALERLKEGNERFRASQMAKRDLLAQIDATSGGQWPFAVVLSCIDSRVSAELVFDQGIGDIFSARIAGNFQNDDILGSMEFACQVAGAKLVVVLGHSHCGAIKGACDGVELGHLTGMLEKLRPAVEGVTFPAEKAERSSANADFVAAVAERNVRSTVEAIAERSDVLRGLRDAGTIGIVGGMYDISTGAVEFY